MKFGLIKKIFLKICYSIHLFIPKCMYTCGAAIFIDRDTFEGIGKFDERIFMYCEEEDIAYRLNRIKKYGAYFPQIRIVHLQGKSTGHDELKTRKQILESSKYICKKYGFDFKKEMRKELFAMKTINGVKRLFFLKPRYSDDVIEQIKEELS